MNPQEPNNTITTPISTKPSGHITIIIMAIFILMCLGSVIFLFYQNQSLKKELSKLLPTPTPESQGSPIPTVDPTSDWKTYENKEFSFKYPTNWTVNGKRLFSPNKSIEIWAATSNDPLFNECMKLDTTQKLDTLTIKSFSGVTTAEMCDPANLNKKEKWIVKANSEGFQPGIQYLYKTNDSDAEKTFDQILSTFKFLDSTSNVPKPISDLFNSINNNFNLNLIPKYSNEFYSFTGMIKKDSWVIDFTNTVANNKSLVTYLQTKLTLNANASAAGGVGGFDAYENATIKCYYSYGYKNTNPEKPTDPYSSLSCALK